MTCANTLCSAAATHFPVIRFGRVDRLPGEGLAYRLEVPKGVCPGCQPRFEPEMFLGDQARAGIDAMLEYGGHPPADFDRLDLEWLPIDHPHFAEIAGGGEARLWF